MHSGKKELAATVNFFQTEVSHVRERFISQLHDNAQINQDMKVTLLEINKKNVLKRLNKLETKFTGWKKKIA